VNDAAKLIGLIRRGESESVEFKETFNREALEAVCAFANTAGGMLLIGISDRGQVNGIQTGKEILKDWANQISQGTGLHPSIEIVHVKGKEVTAIRVPESRIKPVMFHGKAYKRSGSITRQMNMEELTHLALTSVGVTWDEVPEVRATIADISMAKVKTFVRLVSVTGRRPIPPWTSATELLEKLELLRKKRPTRAAILPFGKNPQKFYLQAVVKAGRFRGETLVVDDREIEGTLFEQVEGAMNYFRERLKTRFEMTGKPQRKVIWEYPLDALREGVINAVCHRDYLCNGHTEIRIYDRQLMLWNPGGLPTGISLAMLRERHPSVPRNRLIANVLFYAGLIEQWGSGIQKMNGECETLGLPKPKFEEVMGFRVTFGKNAVRATDQVPTKYRSIRDKNLGKRRIKFFKHVHNPKTFDR